MDSAYEQWKAADAAALALERQVHAAWEQHEAEEAAPAPSRELLREAAYLRHVADEKLRQAIALIPGLPAESRPEPRAAAVRK